MGDLEIDRWNLRASVSILVALAHARVRSAQEHVLDAAKELEAIRDAAEASLREFNEACADAERVARLWGEANDLGEDVEEVLAWNRPTTCP